MEIGILPLAIYAVASFVMAVLSGASGAGGGIIMTPLLIFFGLSPAQAVSTGKIAGLAVTIGSLHGLKAHKVENKKLIFVVMGLALAVGLIAPLFITSIDSVLYRRLLGILMLLMVPVLLMHKPRVDGAPKTAIRQTLGFIGLTLALLLQAVFSGGMGTLVNVVLITLLGLTPLDANVTKRWSQLLLNVVIVLGVIGSGLIVWEFVLIGVITCVAGGIIGSRMAIKRGDEFVKRILILVVCLAAGGLLFG